MLAKAGSEVPSANDLTEAGLERHIRRRRVDLELELNLLAYCCGRRMRGLVTVKILDTVMG